MTLEAAGRLCIEAWNTTHEHYFEALWHVPCEGEPAFIALKKVAYPWRIGLMDHHPRNEARMDFVQFNFFPQRDFKIVSMMLTFLAGFLALHLNEPYEVAVLDDFNRGFSLRAESVEDVVITEVFPCDPN